MALQDHITCIALCMKNAAEWRECGTKGFAVCFPLETTMPEIWISPWYCKAFYTNASMKCPML